MSPAVYKTFAASAVLASLLSACGGGGGDSDSGDPAPRAIPASVAVGPASDSSLNGIYASSTIALNEVVKFNPVGGDPETCRFRFAGLQQAGTTRLMDGDIRYIPGTTELRVTFVSIAGTEFRLQGTAGATVDKPNNRVVYNGAILTSTQGSGNTITLSGSIPMLTSRPEGC
jgi:hypothetical protein